jgi:alpha-1,2-mannosyltransferase
MPRASAWNLYGLPILMVAACIVTIVAVARRPDVGTTDFRTFYQSGRQYLANTNPYVPFDVDRGPNLNPPWVVAIMAQVCRAPLPWAAGVWWTFSFACFFTAIGLIARAVAPGQFVAIASLVLVTQAAYANVRLGQVAWQVMLLMTAAWLADRSRRPVLCGVLLGLVMSWKPFLLVFAPYLLWRREWRALAAMTATIGCTVVLGLVAVGSAGYASWFDMLRLVEWAGHPLNASIRALLTRVLTPASLAEQPTTPLIVAPDWLDPVWIVGVVALAAVAIRRVSSSRNTDVAWAALTLAALLVSPLGWIHYVPIVTGPLVAVLINARPIGLRLAAVGWLFLCVPFAWLKATTFGPALTLTVASAYSWGTLLLFLAVVRSKPIDTAVCRS